MGRAEQVDHFLPATGRLSADRRMPGALSSTDQLVRLDLDADDVVADEVSVITFCGILDMPADGGCDESLDLGRRHPAHRSGTPRLSVEEG